LFKTVYIKKILSSFFLLVFLLGMTPKRFLHDLFAKHTDVSLSKSGEVPYRLNKAGFNCDCETLVAESVYVSHENLFFFPLLTTFSPYIFKDVVRSPFHHPYNLLRGPPVNI